jgi:hypothetical protein
MRRSRPRSVRVERQCTVFCSRFNRRCPCQTTRPFPGIAHYIHTVYNAEYFDKDGGGTIDSSELHAVLVGLGEAITEEEVCADVQQLFM